ncbi:MAG: DNA internalization-related competence protein ComEC/Rec2 [Chlamydiota bacterium]
MRRPAFWLACAFAGGILACAPCRVKPAIPAALLALAAAGAGVHLRGERTASAATLSAAFFAGVCVCALHERCLDRSDLGTLFGDRAVCLSVRGTVRQAPAWERQPDERGEPRWKGVGALRISAAETARGWIPLSGDVCAVLVADAPLALTCGDEVEIYGVLRRIREATNPGQFDGRAFWRRRGIEYSLAVNGSRGVRGLRSGTQRRIAGRIEALRLELRRRLEAGMPGGPPAQVILAMILGIREQIGDEIARPFQLTNTMHILAISGLHVGFFFLMVRAALSLLRVPRRLAAIIAIPLIGLYAVVTGAAVPVLRASLMFIALLAAPFAGRQRDALNALGLAALAILAASPLQLFDTGFQLSFIAVLSILVLSGPLAALFHRVWPCRPLPGQLLIRRGERVGWWWGSQAIGLVSASIATWIGMAPFIASSFHIVTALGLIGNMVVIPAGFAIVCLGFSGILVSCVSMQLAGLINRLNCCVAGAMLAAIDLLSRIPYSWHYVSAPGPLTLCLYYGIVAAGILVLRGTARGRWKALLLSAMALMPLLPGAFIRDPPVLRITFLDVGQGDSACVEFPGGEILLVDAGPHAGVAAGRRIVTPFLKSLGCSRVETALLTHAHDDHYGGFDAVLGEFPVDRAVIGTGITAPVLPRGPPALGRGSRGKIFKVSGGDLLAEGDGVRITVLNPGGGTCSRTQTGQNNGSVALMMTFGRTRVLLCGDMEREAEETLCRRGVSLKADVLKVGHHGGASSCTKEFLRRVSPRWAIVSAGAQNRFGHPSPETLARLREEGAAVLRTDLHGAVTFTSDGVGWKVTTFR